MNLRKSIATVSLLAILPLAAACGAGATDTTDSAASTTTSSMTTPDTDDRDGGGGQGAVDVSSVTTEAALVELVQSAYGDAGLGLHRGHQPVESVLDEVLQISHNELHVRMEEQGQNLAAIATDLGIDPQTLVDALVESWSPAIDGVLAIGAITEAEAADYRAALEEAFTFRVTWDGSEATPTFAGLTA